MENSELKEAMEGYLKIEKRFLPGKSTGDFTDTELGQIVKRCSVYIGKNDVVREAIEVLCNALREDTSEGSYYHSWQANIAMAFQDEFNRQMNEHETFSKYLFVENGLHHISNNAAKNFLNLLIK